MRHTSLYEAQKNLWGMNLRFGYSIPDLGTLRFPIRRKKKFIP
jgi:hypothetical protein